MNGFRHTVITAALVSACGAGNSSPSELSAVIGDDNMIEVAADGGNIPQAARDLLGAIGKSSDKCTAFHIGQGVAVTAGHCMANLALMPNAPCLGRYIDWHERNDGGESLRSRCIRVFDQQLTETSDYAFFEVDPAPRTQLDLATATTDTSLAVLGFPENSPLFWSPSCHGKLANNRLMHDCDTKPGNSGSPIFDSETSTVIGIHNGGSETGNYGTPLSATMIDKLQEQAGGARSPNEETDSVMFGPFDNNVSVLLKVFSSAQGASVSFALSYDTEDGYDVVKINDGRGKLATYTGRGTVAISNAPTPVVVAFESDYRNESRSIAISDVTLK